MLPSATRLRLPIAPPRRSRKGTREVSAGEDHEGQALAVVVFDPVHPVGYAGLQVSLLHDAVEREVFLSFRPELVYVTPTRRGRGYGLDLSLACGWICREVLEAVYRAVPAGTVIQSHVYADYESTGGEAFTGHLHGCLGWGVDMLRETGKRRSVTFDRVELDAGY